MADASGWSSELPSGSSQLRKSDDQIRSDKSTLEALLNEEHYAFSTSSNVSAGVHQLGSARPYVGAASSVSTAADQGRLMWVTDAEQLAYVGHDSLRTLPSLATVNQYTDNQKVQVASGASVAFSILSTSGSTARYQLRGDGYQQWSDGQEAVDVNLYRGGANLLQSDDTFQAVNLHADSEISAVGALKGSEVSSSGTIYGDRLHLSGGTIAFGSDLSWYDGGTNIIKTDDLVWTTSNLSVDNTLSVQSFDLAHTRIAFNSTQSASKLHSKEYFTVTSGTSIDLGSWSAWLSGFVVVNLLTGAPSGRNEAAMFYITGGSASSVSRVFDDTGIFSDSPGATIHFMASGGTVYVGNGLGSNAVVSLMKLGFFNG